MRKTPFEIVAKTAFSDEFFSVFSDFMLLLAPRQILFFSIQFVIVVTVAVVVLGCYLDESRKIAVNNCVFLCVVYGRFVETTASHYIRASYNEYMDVRMCVLMYSMNVSHVNKTHE